MIFPDYHFHSSFSSDCETDMNNNILQAIDKGMKSICITDHYDMDFPKLPDLPDMDFFLDMSAYYPYMLELKKKYDNKIDLKIGVEMGIIPSVTKKAESFIAEHRELDFVISSCHLVDGIDPYYPEYFEGISDKEGYRRYFEALLYNVKNFKNYDVCGHIDYIVRYGRTKTDEYFVKDYIDIFEELLKTIIADGKGIELNTGSLYKGISFPHPHMDILKLYKRLGGEIITIGSDAHKEEYIGYGFDMARDILLSLGFKYYCEFTKRKPEFIKII